MELVPVCLCVLAPANLCPCEIWSLCEVGVRRCTRLVHRATVLLRVSTVVAFCAALIGGGAVGAKAEITASVPAGVHWRASPEGMPLWGPNRFWPGSGLVLRCLGPGFTVLDLGPGCRPILILILSLIIIINRRSGITSHTSHGHKTGTRSMQPVRSVPLGGPVVS